MVQVRVDDSVGEPDGDEVWSVYRQVWDDQPDPRSWLEDTWGRHREREGFRVARAYDGGRLIGFVYGYTGQHGQWWTDHAREVLEPEVAAAWLGGHLEVVSLGVLESARRRGTGRRLLRALLTGVPHQRMLLMTSADASDPARRPYESEGWRVLGRGIRDGTVIMGRSAGPRRVAG